MDEQKRIKAETQILNVSMFGVVFFIIVETIMTLATSSQSILMDAVYGAADLLTIFISIKIIPILYKPTSEKHPFGFSQVEAIFIAIKGSMLTAVTVGLLINNIQIILKGGNPVSFTSVALFELFAAIVCGVILLIMFRMNKTLNSSIVKAEINAWLVDAVTSAGLAVAFILPAIIQTEWMKTLSVYLDQIVAIVLSALILPMPIKTTISGLRDLFLLAPDPETTQLIKKIGQDVLKEYHFEETFYDIIKTGRKIWISIYFKSPSDMISISTIRKARDELESELKKEFPDLYIELVPEFEF
ncbi:MAG TPA: cation transporter [Clostridiales bacterium]|nr:cation transporter [Clostridiales bacterium]